MAAAGLDVAAGVADIRRLVVDTRDSVVRGQGTIDLGAETLDLRLEGQDEDVSLIDPDAPVLIRGSLRAPDLSVGGTAFIPLIELGLQGNAPCDTLTKEVLAMGGEGRGD